jgi:ABC-2 type transport system permease protein
MINLLRSEFIKLRTVVMNWVLMIIALLFPTVITLITAARANPDDFDARSLVEVLTGTAFVPILLASVVAAASVTSEFGFGTIRPTFTATPRRGRVMVAKAIVVVTYAVVVQTIVVTVSWFGGRALADRRPMDLDAVPTGINVIVGVVVVAGLMALAGLGVGMIIRSTPAAIAFLILWPLMAEALIGGLLGLLFSSEQLIGWMPFRAGFQMTALEIVDGPSRIVGGLYFGAVSIGLMVLGTWLVNRRDA